MSGSSWDKMVYRLRCLPVDFSQEEVSRVIQEEYNVSPAEFKLHSLSLDVIEEGLPRQKVATITFQSKPSSLPDSEEREWSFEVASLSDTDTDAHRVYLDTHFRGLTPLSPERNEKDCDIDCIFVHGWGANAMGSLIADDPKYVWLRDDLPSRFPNLRIWTYGYGRELTDEAHISDPFEYAERLKNTLQTLRSRADKKMPIIFIAHSLGGIIVKQAIISMSKSDETDDRQNLQLITGALFFGVPGLGMDVTALANMVYGLPSQHIIHLLDKDSSFRQRSIQDEDFHRIWAEHDFDAISFFELQRPRTVVKTADGWSRTGPYSLLVEPGSATYGRHNQERKGGGNSLEKDHFSLMRFSKNDQEDYFKVCRALRRLVDTAQDVVQRRVERQSLLGHQENELELQQLFLDGLFSQISESRTRQIPEAADGTYEWIFDGQSFETSEDEDSNYMEIDDEDTSETDSYDENVDNEGNIGETSNSYGEISFRVSIDQQNERNSDRSHGHKRKRSHNSELIAGSIGDPLKQPLKKQKLNQARETGFSKWLREDQGIYWVTGRPGSGKSTLIKFIAQHTKTKNALQEWKGSADISLIIASFYFWISGVPLQRSLIGLLQSIFYQLLGQDRNLIQVLFPREWRSHKQSKHIEWTEDSFMSAVDSLKHLKSLQQHKFCFFIDGLDEYRDVKDHDWLCCFLLKLGSLEYIKLCVSSRYWTDFRSAFCGCPTLKLHEWTRSDIDEFVVQELGEHYLWANLQQTHLEETQNLVTSISTDAKGVFLWVVLVVRSLIKGLERHESIQQLVDRLHAMPKTLEDFFKRIIEDLPAEDHDFAVKALLLVQAYSDWIPPPVVIFTFLEEKDPSFGRNAPFGVNSLEHLRTTVIRIRSRIDAICSDLLSIEYHHDITSGELSFALDTHVGFGHRTMSDYFQSSTGAILLLLHDKSQFNIYAWFDEALLILCKSLPTRAPLPDSLQYLWLLYNMWVEQPPARTSGETLSHAYFEELDRTIKTIMKTLSVDILHWSVILDNPEDRVHPSSLLEYATRYPWTMEYFRVKLTQPENLPETVDFPRLFDQAFEACRFPGRMHPSVLVRIIKPNSDRANILAMIQQASFKLFQNGARSDYFVLEAIPLFQGQEEVDCAYNLVQCKSTGERSIIKTYRSNNREWIAARNVYKRQGLVARLREFRIIVD